MGLYYDHPNGRRVEIIGGAKRAPESAVRFVLDREGYAPETVELAVLTIGEDVTHAAIGRCECGAFHLPADAFRLNREAAAERENPGHSVRA